MGRSKESGQWILLMAVFIIATCGLIYELVAGTLASYLLGDSITQFSTIIGVYLFSMGIGSFLSKYLNGNLLKWFVRIEILVGFVGGLSAAVLFLVFPLASSFRILLYAFVSITGILVGLEIPLLMRILKDRLEFKDLVSQVFTFDYIGALLASLIFPLLLVPHLGLIRTSAFFGIMNIAVGIYLSFRFADELKPAAALRVSGVLLIFVELFVFVFSEKIMNLGETMVFNDQVIFSHSSPYQRIVITRNKKETRLFLNGNLQFSSFDEYRYHEALVHPVMSAVNSPQKILILGGGDGLAAREVLKYTEVKEVSLVDLDASMTGLFQKQEILKELNLSSLTDSRIKIYNEDAFQWLRNSRKLFDVIIIDFPDPSNFSIGKLYSQSFYSLLSNVLAPEGMAVVQSTSPFVAPKSFWCINATIQAALLQTLPYHNYVPSFGEWGYILVSHQNSFDRKHALPEHLKYFDDAAWAQMKYFPNDMKAKESLAVNRLNNQSLVHYFEAEWAKYLNE